MLIALCNTWGRASWRPAYCFERRHSRLPSLRVRTPRFLTQYAVKLEHGRGGRRWPRVDAPARPARPHHLGDGGHRIGSADEAATLDGAVQLAWQTSDGSKKRPEIRTKSTSSPLNRRMKAPPWRMDMRKALASSCGSSERAGCTSAEITSARIPIDRVVSGVPSLQTHPRRLSMGRYLPSGAGCLEARRRLLAARPLRARGAHGRRAVPADTQGGLRALSGGRGALHATATAAGRARPRANHPSV